MVRWCKGRGVTYHERLRRCIPCPDYIIELTVVLMMTHRRRMHGTEPEIYWNRLLVSQTEHIPQVLTSLFPKVVYQSQCPFPVCPGSLQTWNSLRNHFNRHHWGYSLQILEEHPTLFPNCERFGSQVILAPW